MKSFRALAIAGLLSSLCIIFISVNAAETPGSLPGSASANSSGSATYSIPLQAVPGTGGVEPKLSLQYNSQAGNGILGIGWSLSGLSTISRIGTTEYLENSSPDYLHSSDDYAADAVDFDDTDRLALDGQRLILTSSGSYSAANATYRMENDQFAHIKGSGTLVGDGTKFPNSFTVKTKDGLTMYYGQNADSRIEAQGRNDVMIWALDKVEDTVGNTMTFKYAESTTIGEYYLDEIVYSWSSGTSGYSANKVEINYEDNGADEDYFSYLAGTKKSLTKRIDNIQMIEGSTIVRQYDFTYETDSNTQFSRLTEVKLTSGGDNLPKTLFTYQNYNPGSPFSELGNENNGWNNNPTASFYWGLLASDSLGNGKGELHNKEAKIYYFDESENKVVQLDHSIEFTSASSDEDPLNEDPFKIKSISGDFNGDGVTDFLVGYFENEYTEYEDLDLQYYTTYADYVWRVFLSSEDNGQPSVVYDENPMTIDTDVEVEHVYGPSTSDEYYNEMEILTDLLVGDVNGDGRSDLVGYDEVSQKYTLELANFEVINSVDRVSFISYGNTTALSGPTETHSSETLMDFNGDGMVDLLITYEHSNGDRYIDVFLSNGTGFELSPEATFDTNTSCETDDAVYISDVNGDGLADILFKNITGSSTTVTTVLSTGTSWVDNGDVSYSNASSSDQQSSVADVNADGRTDFVVWYNSNNDIHMKVFFSRGEKLYGSATTMTTEHPWNVQDAFVPMDFDGDGLTEFMWMDATTTNYRYNLKPFIANGNRPGLLTEVTNGFGAKTKFVYSPITDDSVYIRDRSKTYPIASIQGAYYVVSTLKVDDGLGSANTDYDTVYLYTSGDSHQWGRGFLGFNQFTTWDDQTGVKVERVLDPEFPYTGMVLESATYIPDNDFPTNGKYNILKKEVNTLAYGEISHTSSGKKTYFPFIKDSTTYSYETNDDYYGDEEDYAPNYPLGENESGPNAYAYSVTTNEFDYYDPDATNPPDVYSGYGNNTRINVKYYEPSTPGGSTFNLTHETNSYNIYYDNTDTGKWHLGRLLFSKTKSQVYGTNADTRIRQSAYKYDTTTGLLTEEVLQPVSPNSYDVSSTISSATTDYKPETGGYDYSARWELKTHHDYDSYGNITKTTVSSPATGIHAISSRVMEYQYDSTKRYITKEINPLGQELETVYMSSSDHKDTSLVKKVIDINDLEVVYEYDKFGRPTNETRPDGTETTTTRYGSGSLPSGAPSTAVFAVASYAHKGATTRLSHDVTVFYDRLGRKVRTKSVNGDGESIYQDTSYWTDMRVTNSTEPYFASGGTQYKTFPYWHPDGRPIGTIKEIEKRDGSGTEQIHTKINHYGLTTHTVANSADVSNQQRTKTVRNAKGEVVEVIDARLNSIDYEYDARGNLTKTTDPDNNTIELGYDMHDNKIDMDDPDAGNWTYDYNALGELVKQTDAESNITVLDYDKVGRLTKRTITPGLGGADLVWKWEYDTATNGIGLIAKEVGIDGFQKVYTYDTLSRLHKVSSTIAGVVYDTITGYDSNGRPSTITYPDNFVVTNHYDGTNYDLYQVTDSNSHTWWTAEDYDFTGRLVGYDLAGATMTHTTTFLAGSNFIKEVRAKRSTVDLLHMEYDFDHHGNVIRRKDTFRNHEEEFAYDDLNRLDQRRQKLNGGSWTSWTDQATYDELGNILTKNGVSGSYTYGSSRPHAVTSVDGVTYTYNNNGNVKLRGDNAIWWTPYNKPLSIFSDDASYSFYYDNDFNRIIETIYENGSSRVKINPTPLYQVEIEDGTKTRFRHIPTPVGVVGVSKYIESSSTTERRYFINDHLGSSSVITNDAGTVQQSYSYDAWGNPRTVGWGSVSAWPDYEADEGFTGHEMMSSLELVHMNGRVYDPLIGRCLSPDIFIQAEGNLQNYNRYSYVLNNPLKYTDPSGNSWFGDLLKVVVAIYGGPYAWLWIAAIEVADVYIETGDIGVAFKSGVIAGASTYFAGQTGDWFQTEGAKTAFQGYEKFAKAAAHGVRGGITAELAGGNFTAGFGAAFVGDYGPEKLGGGILTAAILGGTVSEIGGGKFANGAISGAMTFVLNDLKHRQKITAVLIEKGVSEEPIKHVGKGYRRSGTEIYDQEIVPGRRYETVKDYLEDYRLRVRYGKSKDYLENNEISITTFKGSSELQTKLDELRNLGEVAPIVIAHGNLQDSVQLNSFSNPAEWMNASTIKAKFQCQLGACLDGEIKNGLDEARNHIRTNFVNPYLNSR